MKRGGGRAAVCELEKKSGMVRRRFSIARERKSRGGPRETRRRSITYYHKRRAAGDGFTALRGEKGAEF